MEQIVNVRILQFLEKVALTPGGRLTWEVLRSHTKPVGPLLTNERGPKNDAMSTRQSHTRALKAAGVQESTSDGGAFGD
jgi:hypothetical protein